MFNKVAWLELVEVVEYETISLESKTYWTNSRYWIILIKIWTILKILLFPQYDVYKYLVMVNFFIWGVFP